MMMELGMVDMIALAAVVLIGLPHGAFDGAVYTQMPYPKTGRYFIGFLILYIVIALAVIGIWLWLPLISLLLFLAISAFHFGKGDTADITGKVRIAGIISHGGLVAIFLPFMHQEEAFAFFAMLTFSDISSLAMLESLFDIAMVIWVLNIALYGVFCMKEHRRRKMIELAGLIIVMGYLPILAGFAVYFCLIHSARHFTTLYRAIRHSMPKYFISLGIGLTVASWAAGLFAFTLLVPNQGFAYSVIQIIFIGLAALTVPHMILIDGYWRPLAFRSKG